MNPDLKKVDMRFRAYDCKRTLATNFSPKLSQGEITCIVLKQLGMPINKTNFKKMSKSLWWRRRPADNGKTHDLRLSREGFDILHHQLKIKAYSFHIEWVYHIKSTMWLYMIRNLPGPYIKLKNEIVVLGLANYLKMLWFMSNKRRHGLTQALALDFFPVIYTTVGHALDMDDGVAEHVAFSNRDDLNTHTRHQIDIRTARKYNKRINKALDKQNPST